MPQPEDVQKTRLGALRARTITDARRSGPRGLIPTWGRAAWRETSACHCPQTLGAQPCPGHRRCSQGRVSPYPLNSEPGSQPRRRGDPNCPRTAVAGRGLRTRHALRAGDPRHPPSLSLPGPRTPENRSLTGPLQTSLGAPFMLPQISPLSSL